MSSRYDLSKTPKFEFFNLKIYLDPSSVPCSLFEESEESFSEESENSFDDEDDLNISDFENEKEFAEFDLWDAQKPQKPKVNVNHKQAYITYLKSMKSQELANVLGTSLK